mgnify:CR=1 FL=1
MDMYQKRKMRQEKVKNGNKEENSKYNINWICIKKEKQGKK